MSRLLWTPIHEMETAHFGVSCKIFQAAAFICPGQLTEATISFKTVHLCRHRVTLGGERKMQLRKNPLLQKKGGDFTIIAFYCNAHNEPWG